MSQHLFVWKLFDRVLAPFEQSYVELAAFLGLCLLATAALVVRRRRQVWRFLVQLISLIVFFFVVSSCLGVFGLIRNAFLGLRLLGEQDDLSAFYWLSMTVVALGATFVGGAVFCGWICPTGTLQEWAGWLGRRLGMRSAEGRERRMAALVGWCAVVAAYLMVAYRVFSGRRPILEDSATLWAGSLSVLVALVLLAPRAAASLKRFRAVSLLLILGFTVAGISVFSPVHFIFMNVQDWASLLSGLVIVGAGFFVLRAWCRYLCPFGLICGWAGRYAVFQIEKSPACSRCGVCSRVCEVEAVADGNVNVTSCIACMKCVDHCPEKALALVARPFGASRKAGCQPAPLRTGIILLLICGAVSARAATVDVLWDGFRGGPEATAWRGFEAVGTSEPASSWTFRGANVVWNYSPGVSVWSSPAVAEVGGRVVCFVGSYDHNVYALDIASGRELWRHATGNGVYSTPAVVRIGGRECVLVSSSDRTLYCLDARTGVKVWAYEVYEWRQSLGRAFLASPIVVSGSDGPSIVLVSWVFDTAPRLVTEVAEVRAFDPENGRLRWKRTFAESHPTHPAAGEVGGQAQIYVGCRDGNLYCLDAKDGSEIWRRTSKFPIDGTPAFLKPRNGGFDSRGGQKSSGKRGTKLPLVLVGSKFGDVRAFDAESGDVVWSFKAGNWVDATPAIVRSPDGRDLAVFGSYDGRVYCLDAQTGSKRWRYATRGNVAASATIIPRENGFEVYVPSDDDVLHAIDGSSGRPIWQVSPGPFLWVYRGMGDTIWESPAAARIGSVDMLIVPFYDGRIHGYRLDRSREWLPQMGDPAYGRAMLGRIGASMLGTLVLALGFMWRGRAKDEGRSTKSEGGRMKVEEMRRLLLRGRPKPTIRNPKSTIRLRQGYGGQVRNHSRMWLALVALGMAWLGGVAFGGARVEGDWIVVSGKGNTLESVARDVGDKAILSFDPETGSATSARSLRILGELMIGGARTSGTLARFANSLEFDVGKCGQARIVLDRSPGGSETSQIESPKSEIRNPKSDIPRRLVIENARIATVRTDEGNDACKNEGNVIEAAAGSFVLRNSEVSGNFLLRASGGSVEIENSLIGTSNHTGVSLSGPGISRTRIARLRSLDHKIYGMEIGPVEQTAGPSKSPLTLEECTIRGGGADLHVRGRTQVVARDCDFDSVRFAGEGGSVRHQWTVIVQTSAPGCRVVAESEKGAAVAERVEATADTSGVARLVLTECTAQPGGLDYLQRGRNDSTPHRLTVYSADGKTVLGRLDSYRVFARGQEVRIP